MLRILFFGMTGVFSRPPLKKLLSSEIKSQAEIMGVIIPAASEASQADPRQLHPTPPPLSDIPLLNPHFDDNIIHLAWEHKVPVWEVGSLTSPQTLTLLTDLQPDFIAVACFSQIFPATLLNLPQYGCVNVHPSPLPAYRGPSPLFWLAQQGEPEVGVTIHLIDEGVDSGRILAQTTFAWPEGIAEAVLDERCAAVGGDLLAEIVKDLADHGELVSHPQNEAQASYFPFPADDDFRIPLTWSAQRAFNFLRFGEKNWPLWIDTGAKQIFVKTVLSYDLNVHLGQVTITQGDELLIQFSPGVLRVRVQAIF